MIRAGVSIAAGLGLCIFLMLAVRVTGAAGLSGVEAVAAVLIGTALTFTLLGRRRAAT